MEVENTNNNNVSGGKDEDEDVPLPGFRFHPTDEELVAFYLKRKVEKKPISLELIKQIDIYKHDPWDLPKASNVGDKEGYFFCKRGRKYRNSIRPNRVTGSGFWKATGIDRPIYSGGGECRDCIGLKKSLVYYRGSAGKGTKTDWMMHEFRLPADHDKSTNHIDAKTILQEAEIWTLCRIFKRNVSYRKCMPADLKEMSAKKNPNSNINDASSKTCSFESNDNNQSYISFTSPQNHERKPLIMGHADHSTNQLFMGQFDPVSHHQAQSAASYTSFGSSEVTGFLKINGDWDELRSVVELGSAAAPNFLL